MFYYLLVIDNFILIVYSYPLMIQNPICNVYIKRNIEGGTCMLLSSNSLPLAMYFA